MSIKRKRWTPRGKYSENDFEEEGKSMEWGKIINKEQW